MGWSSYSGTYGVVGGSNKEQFYSSSPYYAKTVESYCQLETDELTKIVELYFNSSSSADECKVGLVTPTQTINNNTTLYSDNSIYSFSDQQISVTAYADYQYRRRVYAIHQLDTEQSIRPSWDVAYFGGSGSGCYGVSNVGMNSDWVEFISGDSGSGNISHKYFSITTSQNNSSPYFTVSLSAGQMATFYMHTCCESEYDGIMISVGGNNTSFYDYYSDNEDWCCTGLNVTNEFTYHASSSTTLYVYFKTDARTTEGVTFDYQNTPSYSTGDVEVIVETDPNYNPPTPPTQNRTITLDSTHGSGGTSSITIPVGAALTSYPNNITHPSRSSCSFLGYYSSKYSNGTCYYNALLNNGQGSWVNTIPGSDNVTIYAHWLNNISVTFKDNPIAEYSPNSQTLRIVDVSAYCPYGDISYNMDNDDGFSSYDRYITINVPAGLTPGNYYLDVNLYSETNNNDGTLVIGDNYSERVVITIEKASQSAPTSVTSDYEYYPNSVQGGASGGGGHGTLYYRIDTNGGTSYGSETQTRPSRSAVGTTTYIAYWGGDEYYNASPYSSQGSISVYKGSQPMYITPTSMTLYSITSDGDNNPTGYTYNTGTITPSNNQGNVSYSSSDTSVATVDSNGNVTYKGAGSCTITVTAAGNGNYESGSCTCSVTCILDTLGSTRYSDTNGTVGYNTTYGTPTVSIGDGLLASGGSAEVSCSVTNTLSWYKQYTTGWWSDLQTDTELGTVRWRITSNGNSRFSSPSSGESTIYINGYGYYTYATGTNVSHSDMTTNETSDIVTVTAYNVDDTSKYASTSETITNSLENQEYTDTNGTAGYNMTYGTPEVEMGYGLSASGGNAVITCSVTDTKTYYKRYTSGSYTSLLSESFNGDARWKITSNGNNRFYNASEDSKSTVNGIDGYVYFSNQRVYHDSMGIDITTDTVIVTVYNVSDISKSTSVSQSISNDVTELILVVVPTTVEYGDSAEANVVGTFTSGESENVSSECEFSTDPSDIVNIS